MNENLLSLLKEEIPTHYAECVEVLTAANVVTLEKFVALSVNAINALGFKPKLRSLVKSLVFKKLSGVNAKFRFSCVFLNS
jgi:hypothetical protein